MSAGSNAPDPERLAALRARIDTLDVTLHEALIERSAIIDELIHAKGSRASAGAIFRPGREADMMRRLAGRHRGSLPLADVEALWHAIIAAHTALQSPFELFVDMSGDPLPSWDAARFLVGFAVPVSPCGSPDLVLDAMAETIANGGSALGVVPVADRTGWWHRLGDEVHVMARTPAIAIEPHRGGTPHWVLSPPLSDPVPFDVPLTRLRVPQEAMIEDTSVIAASGEHVLVEGEVPAPLRDAALDAIPCGGYHRPAQPEPDHGRD